MHICAKPLVELAARLPCDMRDVLHRWYRDFSLLWGIQNLVLRVWVTLVKEGTTRVGAHPAFYRQFDGPCRSDGAHIFLCTTSRRFTWGAF